MATLAFAIAIVNASIAKLRTRPRKANLDMALAKRLAFARSASRTRGQLTRIEREERRFALWMILPTVIAVLAIMGYPWMYSLWMSLNSVNLLTQRWTFVGLENYTGLIGDSSFTNSLIRTAWFSATVVVGGTVMGLAMALALNENFKGRALMRSVMLLPWAIAPVVVGKLFTLIYSGSYGVLNGVMLELGLIDTYVPLLSDSTRALLLVGLASIWQSAPLSGLLLLAALQAIPSNLYNAAKIDGATAWQRFRRITLPWLRPMLIFVVILNTINAVMTFDLIYVLTQGGPGEATTVLSWLGYVTFFNFARYGEGTAILYILSLICLVLAVVYFRAMIDRSPRAGDSTADPGTTSTGRTTRTKAHSLGEDLQVVRPEIRTPRISPVITRRMKRALFYVGVFVIAFWSLAPFYVMLNASLSTTNGILSQPPSWFPNPITLENYRAVIFGEQVQSDSTELNVQARAIMISMKNSAIVAVSVTLLNVIIGAPAGYAFARYKQYRFTSAALWTLMMTRMIPPLTLAVPFFMIFRRVGLLDTKLGLVIALSSVILPLTVWIMKGYFESMPPNLERAGLVDGCTRFQSFRRIVLPVSLPGLAAAGIFCFLIAWNEFIYAILLTSTLDSQTLPTRIAQFISDQRVYNPGLLFAAGALTVLPPVLITLLFQRYLLRGMLSGAVKG